MAHDFGDAVGGKAVIARDHHDVLGLRHGDASLVGPAQAEIHRVVKHPDPRIGLCQFLHPRERPIGAAIVDQNDFERPLGTHGRADRLHGRGYVVLLVEAGNNETDPRPHGHPWSKLSRISLEHSARRARCRPRAWPERPPPPGPPRRHRWWLLPPPAWRT